jgi:hypothetical protein
MAASIAVRDTGDGNEQNKLGVQQRQKGETTGKIQDRLSKDCRERSPPMFPDLPNGTGGAPNDNDMDFHVNRGVVAPERPDTVTDFRELR